jgi:hypothetical protein
MATLPKVEIREDSLAPVTPMSLMQMALERGQVEQLQILQDMHFRELARSAEVEFNLAMNAVQSELGRIAPNLENTQTSSKYASYAALDKVIRPIYTKHGFSLSFDSGESPAGTVIAFCFVSHSAGHTRKYQSPAMPLPVQGPKGNAVMTQTHGTGAAMSYAMRYLLKFIFNIAIGSDDDDGNGDGGMSDISEKEEWIKNARNADEVERQFKPAYRAAYELGDKVALTRLEKARESRMKELRGGR